MQPTGICEKMGEMIKNICRYKKWIVFLIIIVLLSGCLEQRSVPETKPSTEQDLNTLVQTDSVKTIIQINLIRA